MTTKPPTEDQVQAACAILKKFTNDTRGTASDTMVRNAVFSMFAALGGPGQPSEEYASVVAAATGGDVNVAPMIKRTQTGFVVAAVNPLGLAVGDEYRIVHPTNDDDVNEEQDAGTDTETPEPETETKSKRKPGPNKGSFKSSSRR